MQHTGIKILREYVIGSKTLVCIYQIQELGEAEISLILKIHWSWSSFHLHPFKVWESISQSAKKQQLIWIFSSKNYRYVQWICLSCTPFAHSKLFLTMAFTYIWILLIYLKKLQDFIHSFHLHNFNTKTHNTVCRQWSVLHMLSVTCWVTLRCRVFLEHMIASQLQLLHWFLAFCEK